MRLAAVANRFNRAEVRDAYTGDLICYGQLGLYDDSKRDSETAERRVLSLAPDIDLPTRRVVAINGVKYIIGHANPDVFDRGPIRVGYVLHETTDLVQVRTLAEVCLGQTGFTAWSARAWVKNAAYIDHTSALAVQHHLHFGVNEPVGLNYVVKFDGNLHLVRQLTKGPAGTLMTFVEEMEVDGVDVASITTGSWDVAADAIVGTTTNIPVLRVRWQSLFQYLNKSAPTFGPEDVQFVIAKSSITPAVGSKMTIGSHLWQIASIIDEGTVWLCRGVRHA